MCRSDPQTPARVSLIKIAPGSGSGTGYSRSSNSPPYALSTAMRPCMSAPSFPRAPRPAGPQPRDGPAARTATSGEDRVWAPACLVDEGLLDKLTEQLPVVASCRPRLILRHQHDDHLLLRVDPEPGAGRPGPRELTHRTGYGIESRFFADRESEAERVAARER